jgi:hypothetical protein
MYPWANVSSCNTWAFMLDSSQGSLATRNNPRGLFTPQERRCSYRSLGKPRIPLQATIDKDETFIEVLRSDRILVSADFPS